MEQYCMYLRKSRADLEAEARGEEETLARHERALLELAKRQHLNVTQRYREIVSGDTIAARPVMQQVLAEVEQGIWTGVLVMEVERLARGDTIDQGIVAQTFKLSDTKIVTPIKTYDPNNEYDEEYFEFGLFMSRREYKTINRRLQRGRLASVKEGKFVSNKTPYGYRRVRLEHEKGWTLEPEPEQAEIVKLIYDWYTVGELLEDGTRRRLGVSLIARKLNEMGVKPKNGGDWVPASIRDILINPDYIGKLRWNWRPVHKRKEGGEIVIERPRSSEVVIVPGLHPALISEETWNLAQEYIHRNRPAPVGRNSKVVNPLAGLVVCGKCGRRMVRRPYQNGRPEVLLCAATSCDNVSSDLEAVERRVLDALRQWLEAYKLQWGAARSNDTTNLTPHRKALEATQKDLDRLAVQENRTHDLLEQGVYDVDTFLDRNRKLAEQKEEVEKRYTALQAELVQEEARAENQKNIIPRAEHLLEVYDTLPTPKAKNDLLKDVLDKVVYTKDHGGRWHGSPDDFVIEIYPKLPQYGEGHL